MFRVDLIQRLRLSVFKGFHIFISFYMMTSPASKYYTFNNKVNIFFCIVERPNFNIQNVEERNTSSQSIIFSPRCPKSFLKAPHLRAHLQTHMGAKLYACEICDKRYASAFSLKTHRVNTHGVGGVKPKCPHCSRTFCNNTFLRRHILESHEKDSRR